MNVFLFLFSLSFLWIPCIRAGPPLSPSFHPHSFVSEIRSVPGGCSLVSVIQGPSCKGRVNYYRRVESRGGLISSVKTPSLLAFAMA
jgi:hypothetical protein